MLELAEDPQLARQQLNGLIFYLTTFSYIDGDFDPEEITFIRDTIQKVIAHRVKSSKYGDDHQVRHTLVRRLTHEFEGVFDKVLGEVTVILNEAVAEAERQHAHVTSKLKQRCFEIFQSFDPDMQKEMIATADGLLMADGHAHAAEVELRNELIALLDAPVEVFVEPPFVERNVEIRELEALPHEPAALPYFTALEKHYVRDDEARSSQLGADRALIHATLATLDTQREHGRGRLAGMRTVEDVPPGEPFLDDFVYVVPPMPNKRYDVTVIGDLHGCYSNVKAALMQSRFLEKVEQYRTVPAGHPEPKLVFLGDYLDRGHLSFEGVLRLAMHLFTTYPDHVYLLRGNHELFAEHEGEIVSAVHPAEAIARLRPRAPTEQLADNGRLFNAMPGILILGRLILTHGGIPRDAVVAETVTDLAGLNDWTVRFQMMWSDPSIVDVIPRSLQESTYRFGFGKLQCLNFLQRLGCHTLIRGHEHLQRGFGAIFDDERFLAVTVFSSGGPTNRDLPEASDFRRTHPMALTLDMTGDPNGPTRLDAWPIDYEPYNAPERNGFYATDPEIPFE